MKTTLIGIDNNSSHQQMGETRDPMAFDCWSDAQRLAETYADKLDHDFWILFAAKPHAKIKNGLVMGWEVIAKKPPGGMLGVLVFKWIHNEHRLVVEKDISLPYDIPISESEMSIDKNDFIESIAHAAVKSKSVLLA